MWVNYVLVGVDVDVFILCDFEGNEVIGDHIADNLELGVFLGDELGDWVGREVRLRKV